MTGQVNQMISFLMLLKHIYHVFKSTMWYDNDDNELLLL